MYFSFDSAFDIVHLVLMRLLKTKSGQTLNSKRRLWRDKNGAFSHHGIALFFGNILSGQFAGFWYPAEYVAHNIRKAI